MSDFELRQFSNKVTQIGRFNSITAFKIKLRKVSPGLSCFKTIICNIDCIYCNQPPLLAACITSFNAEKFCKSVRLNIECDSKV